MVEWISAGKNKYGLQYREHDSLTTGVGKYKRPLRYYKAVVKLNGKSISDVFGWENVFKGGVDKIEVLAHQLHVNRKSKTPPYTYKEITQQRDEEIIAQGAALALEETEQELRKRLIFGNLFKEYINLQPDTRSTKETKSFYKKWLEKDLAEKHLSEIKLLDLERIRRRMEKAGRAPRTVKTIKEIVRPVYNYAFKHELYEGRKPTDSFLDKQKLDNNRLEYYTPEQAAQLLDELKKKSLQTYRITLLSLNTGMRFGEIARLRWLHVNVDRETIFIIDPKNKDSRSSFMTPDVKAMFQEMEEGEPEDLIFPDTRGEIQGKVSNTFPRVVKKLGFNDGVTDRRFNLGFHSLRHTAASWLAEQGVPVVVIAKVLGHKTLEMTMRYTKVNDDQVKDAAKILGKVSAPKKKVQKLVKL